MDVHVIPPVLDVLDVQWTAGVTVDCTHNSAVSIVLL